MKSRHFSLFAGIALVTVMAFALCSLIAVVSGTFVPLQTSTLSEFGVCLQNEVYDPVEFVPIDTKTIYICGSLEGKTKRSIRFRMYLVDDVVYSTRRNWSPPEFFGAIDATHLLGTEVDVFPQGDYRIEAAYSRDPIAEIFFTVNLP